MSPDPSSKPNGLSVFMQYVHTRYPLPLHVFYSITWTLVLLGVFRLAQGVTAPFELAWVDAVLIASVVGLFFFMRTVDEIKDLEYDRIYKPDRALVQGLTTPKQMAGYLAVCAGLLLGMNLALSIWLGLAVSAVMVYSLFLLWLERKVPRFERMLYLNTATSVQLKTLTVGYVYLAHAVFHDGLVSRVDVPLIFGFTCAYLHWEVARKIQWPGLAQPGELLYSATPGVAASLGVSFLLLTTSEWLILGRLAPLEGGLGVWLVPSAAVLLLAFGSFGLWRRRQARFPLGAFAQVGYIAFLLFLGAYSHGSSRPSWLMFASLSLLPLQVPQVQKVLRSLAHNVELRFFRGGVYLTAWLVRSPLHGLSRRIMGQLGAATAVQRGATLQPSVEALGPAWQSMFPVDKRKLPIVRVQGHTVYAEIHEYCPLQATGDLGACDRMMEFDRALLAKLGARLEVLRSQAEPGVKVCQVAFHLLEAERESQSTVTAVGVPT